MSDGDHDREKTQIANENVGASPVSLRDSASKIGNWDWFYYASYEAALRDCPFMSVERPRIRSIHTHRPGTRVRHSIGLCRRVFILRLSIHQEVFQHGKFNGFDKMEIKS